MTIAQGHPPAAGAPAPLPPVGTEIPPLPRLESEPVKVQQVRIAISKAFLPANVKGLLRTLVEVVDWKTWSCPDSESDPGGISMEALARRCGWAGRRNCQKVMTKAVDRGLVTRIQRTFDKNFLRLEVALLLAMGQRGEEDRAQYFAEQKAAGKLPPPLGPKGAAPAAPPPSTTRPAASAARPPAPSAELPDWAYTQARRHTLPASAIHEAVQRIVVATVGDERAPALLRGDDACKTILGRWQRDGRPSLGEWVDQVLVELEVLRACQAQWAAKRREQGHHRCLKFLRSGNQLQALRLGAQAHQAGACACGRRQDAVDAAAAPPRPPPDPATWLTDGRRIGPWTGPPTWRTWAESRDLLRDRLGQAEWEIWIDPIVLLAEGDVTWLGMPHRYHAEWIAEKYQRLLVDVAGTVGLVFPP